MTWQEGNVLQARGGGGGGAGASPTTTSWKSLRELSSVHGEGGRERYTQRKGKRERERERARPHHDVLEVVEGVEQRALDVPLDVRGRRRHPARHRRNPGPGESYHSSCRVIRRGGVGSQFCTVKLYERRQKRDKNVRSVIAEKNSSSKAPARDFQVRRAAESVIPHRAHTDRT